MVLVLRAGSLLAWEVLALPRLAKQSSAWDETTSMILIASSLAAMPEPEFRVKAAVDRETERATVTVKAMFGTGAIRGIACLTYRRRPWV